MYECFFHSESFLQYFSRSISGPFFWRSGCVSGGFQNATTALMGKSPNVTLESLRKGHRHENDFLLLFLFLNLIVTIWRTGCKSPIDAIKIAFLNLQNCCRIRVCILCVCALTTRPEVRATTLEMAYSMARACLWRFMCRSTTPCTSAPSRKFTWPMRSWLRPIFIRALGSSRLAQHTPEEGREEEGRYLILQARFRQRKIENC